MGDKDSVSRASRLEELLFKTSRTFALSIPLLPEPTRREVTVAYLLFRIADTLEDATAWAPAQQVEELRRLAALLTRPTPEGSRDLAHRWLEDPPLQNPYYLELLAELAAVVDALQELAEGSRELVRAQTLRTIERMASFVQRARANHTLQLRTVSELQDYCYAVAGIVGEMLTELFLIASPRLESIAPALRARAGKFGEALQLVNILKDSAADADDGREYLPPDVGLDTVFELARSDLDTAGCYVRDLQQAGAPRGVVTFTALPVLLAWRTLDTVEQHGPGAKLTRGEVAQIAGSLQNDLDHDRPAVRKRPAGRI
jgi:farnesyl-diphosphate farnesyltransferase